MRKTNPISGGAGRPPPAPRPSGLAPATRIVQNEANLRPSGRPNGPGTCHRESQSRCAAGRRKKPTAFRVGSPNALDRVWGPRAMPTPRRHVFLAALACLRKAVGMAPGAWIWRLEYRLQAERTILTRVNAVLQTALSTSVCRPHPPTVRRRGGVDVLRGASTMQFFGIDDQK